MNTTTKDDPLSDILAEMRSMREEQAVTNRQMDERFSNMEKKSQNLKTIFWSMQFFKNSRLSNTL